jgi:hypothetical protein
MKTMANNRINHKRHFEIGTVGIMVVASGGRCRCRAGSAQTQTSAVCCLNLLQ